MFLISVVLTHANNHVGPSWKTLYTLYDQYQLFVQLIYTEPVTNLSKKKCEFPTGNIITFKPELRSALACLSVKYSVTVCDKYWSLQRIQMYWICQLGIKDEYKYYLIFGQIRILILKKIEYSINMTKYLNISLIND